MAGAEFLKSRLPAPLRKALRRRGRRTRKAARRGVGMATAAIRVYPPDFIIGGAQRAGTSALYQYLSAHPAIEPALYKEIHFFDHNFERGTGWYRSHFPTRKAAAEVEQRTGTKMVTGEASPYYLAHPHAAARIAAELPEVKTILLLRDPVERAYSHYLHGVALGHETLSFDEALDREPERLAGEEDRMAGDPSYRSFNHQHFSYAGRGEYAGQVERWLAALGRDRTLILRTEDMGADPAGVFGRVLGHLGLPPFSLPAYPRHNTARGGSKPEMSAAARRRLREHFAGHNGRLYDLLGVAPWWD